MRWSSLLVLAATLFTISPSSARANDAAAAIAAGGVVLREDRRISMRKERLEIRLLGDGEANVTRFNVTVEYEFVNEGSDDVVTEVAFPVPEYGYRFSALEGPVDLGGFRAWVDGAEIHVAKQVRAVVAGKDYAPLLTELGIDVEHHGNFQPDAQLSAPDHPDQLRKLAAPDAERLVQLGLLERSEPAPLWPRWTVAITWHWTQRFPARSVVRVRHEYTPAAGFSYASDVRQLLAGFHDACADEALVHTLEAGKRTLMQASVRGSAEHQPLIFAAWVKYILTTANTWKRPIHDFELVVERPEGRPVSFCWDGKVQKVSKTAFSARVTDFVPTRDLAVYFFRVE